MRNLIRPVRRTLPFCLAALFILTALLVAACIHPLPILRWRQAEHVGHPIRVEIALAGPAPAGLARSSRYDGLVEIPAVAIRHNAGRQFVYRISNGFASRVFVQLAQIHGSNAIVAGDLRRSDLIVTASDRPIFDGAAIALGSLYNDP